MADKPIANPLPADLPEDWQYNQIVAPDGADVGLSAQYGYNYLMEQVNAVQEAVNTINNAFASLASLNANGKIPLDQLIIDTALSATSQNPVQNKVVQEALAGKAASNHTHNYAGSSSAGGAANSAVKLQTARSIHVNLGSTSAANFDGSGNANPGISGILSVGSGGTGANNAAAARTNLGINLANLGGCRIVTGIYRGDGTERKSTDKKNFTGGQFINLGVKPRFVLVSYFYGFLSSGYSAPSMYQADGLAISDIKSYTESNNLAYNPLLGIEIVENGFYVGHISSNYTSGPNRANNIYAYIAII